MTPSNSIAVRFVRRPGRAFSFALKSIWAVIVLLGVCLLWLALFVMFLPFLLVSELLGWTATLPPADDNAPESLDPAPSHSAEAADNPFVFDRRKDVSKLFGCNTRNVAYRWSIFAGRLAEIRSKYNAPNALDFGAGSLRDSFELSKLGFYVVSVDLDKSLLERYYSSYRWETLPSTPRLFANSLDDLRRETGPSSFHLAIAFDVVEHLEDPASTVGTIRDLLTERGLLFTIVPNRRNIFERYGEYEIRKLREKGIPWRPGVPHLQFKDPGEWEKFFEDNGFKILEHDMAIGFFVNNCWSGLLGTPLRVWVSPVLATLAHVSHLRFDSAAFESSFSPAWLMKRVDTWDMMLKEKFRNLFGWNLIVAQKS